MTVLFYVSSAVAIVAAALAVSRRAAMHAVIHMIVALMAIAVMFFSLGAPLAAAFEVIIFAGAIMVLFVFVMMMLALSRDAKDHEHSITRPRAWAGPTLLVLVLLGELAYVLASSSAGPAVTAEVSPQAVGHALFGTYVVGLQLAALVLLSAIVAVRSLARDFFPGAAAGPAPEETGAGGAAPDDSRSEEGAP